MADASLSVSDHQSLLSSARAGDESSLWRMCDRLRPKLRAVAGRILGRYLSAKVDASDIVQVALAEAARALPQFRGNSLEEFEAWIVTIVKNEAFNERQFWMRERRNVKLEKRQLNQPGGAELEPGDESTPSNKVLRMEAAVEMKRFLDRLPPDELQVVHLRHVEEKSLAEIALLINRSPDGTAGLLKRAMKRLRTMMNGEGP